MREIDPIVRIKNDLRNSIVDELGMHTQEVAAHVLGISQPRMSDLVRDRVDRFSLETLISLLARIGLRVDVRVTNVRTKPLRIHTHPGVATPHLAEPGSIEGV
jgi:predicted XRE-type DNA-binding protein